MPAYLFTYHAYGSWWPDRPQGLCKRIKACKRQTPGWQRLTAKAANHPTVVFSLGMQHALIEKVRHVAQTDVLLIYGVSSDPTHLHVLTGWQDDRGWSKVRGRIKNLLSLHLSRLSGAVGRPWFVKEASRKHVKDEAHFEYLLHSYLPKHLGWQWYRDRGWIEPPPCGGGY